MPRKQVLKKCCAPPLMMGYHPFGIARQPNDPISLTFDEFESVRLLDYELLTQEDAAEKMAVSRPTLTRIYERARRSIAKAFVEGRSINMVGGQVQFDREWLRCRKCFMLIPGKENHKPCATCPDFGKPEMSPVDEFIKI